LELGYVEDTCTGACRLVINEARKDIETRLRTH